MIEGKVHPDFARVALALSRTLPRGNGGGAVCIYHRGECVVDVWGGTRDARGNPWRDDTLSFSYSTTKGVAVTLLHILADRGQLDYDERVTKYWPEFGGGGKEDIRVRQLLAHEAGLYDIRGLIDDAQRMLDWPYMVRALENAQPAHRPGAANGYHALTYGWLVGELIQRITGKPLAAVLQQELAGPLALDGLFIGLPDAEHARCADLIDYRGPASWDEAQRRQMLERAVGASERVDRALAWVRIPLRVTSLSQALFPRGIESLEMNSPEVRRAAIPALNGCFTARSLARMYAVLAGGGILGRVRLLSGETLRRATEIQSMRFDRVLPARLQWRLGYHRALSAGTSMLGAFGHYGFGGSGAFADPRRNLAVAFTVNHQITQPSGLLRILRIASAAARSADER
jgi:CubicO group peptidase (beta-lactamase class C family)